MATDLKERRRRAKVGESKSPSRSPTVGRKRQPQAKDVRKTLTGRVGARLEELAVAAGYSTPAQFADALGKTEEAVRHYYRGTRAPKLDEWPKVAKLLGVSVRELLPE